MKKGTKGILLGLISLAVIKVNPNLEKRLVDYSKPKPKNYGRKLIMRIDILESSFGKEVYELVLINILEGKKEKKLVVPGHVFYDEIKNKTLVAGQEVMV